VATKRKNLRTGRPVWQGRRVPAVPHATFSRDVKADVVVVGAGITGASIVDALEAAGAKVAVVDKRGLAQGSTMASTALVLYEIDTPLITLTVRAWRRARLAVESLAAGSENLASPMSRARGGPRAPAVSAGRHSQGSKAATLAATGGRASRPIGANHSG
jgi:glycine/D-amino acid oxidase-like deaminating enzyme